MSFANVQSGHAHGRTDAQQHRTGAEHRSLSRARLGEQVNLTIVNKIADGRYSATVNGSRYVVESSLPFAAGQTVRATVSALGDVVELKYLDGGGFELVDATVRRAAQADRPGGAALDSLQAKFKVTLPDAERELVDQVGRRVSRPEAVAMGALYLSKTGEPVVDESLRALYGRQVWQEKNDGDAAAAADISALISGVQQGRHAAVSTLSNLLGDALENSASAAASQSPAADAQLLLSGGGQTPQSDTHDSSADQDSDATDLAELAQRLLNVQDSGTVAYHYGSLPVVIADQLVELDMVLFREREGSRRDPGSRKLVMTLKTETLGRVEVVAQSIDAQLTVSIATQSPQATERLAAHAQEVRELVARLGWNVDSVAYRLSTQPTRAAEQLIRHVLNSGTLDAIV